MTRNRLKQDIAPPFPELDDESARHILDNVFARCGQPANSIPVDTLKSWGNYKAKSFRLPRSLCAVVLILLFCLPLVFVHPSVKIIRPEEGTENGAEYMAEVTTFLPIENVWAALDGKPVPTAQVSERRFRVSVTRNGTLRVYARSVNGQVGGAEADIRFLDDEKPVVLFSRNDNYNVFLEVWDAFSGVDTGNIACTDASGAAVPLEIEEGETVTITLPIPEGSVLLSIPDSSGNTLYLNISGE